jgi:D-erythrose 4-phosphate dehydrogenase
VRLAINGFGRIGRCLLRALAERQAGGVAAGPLQLVAINELADLETMAYLCRYDSTHGRFRGQVETGQARLRIDAADVVVSHLADPLTLPWAALDIDLVMECSGAFRLRTEAAWHLQAGAGRVLFSQPASQDVDATVVFGTNESALSKQASIVSAASCTTNCIVPVIDALDRALGVEHGVITTIHSAMNDQPVLDGYHHTDLRKTRAASHSIIPVDTALARGIGRILPHLADRFEAQAMRVPTLNVSAMDLSVLVSRDTTSEEVNRILAKASVDCPRVLGYTAEPLASCDFVHDPRSAIIDASQTRVSGRQLVKVLAWFDNEWGFANRMLDVAQFWGQRAGLVD